MLRSILQFSLLLNKHTVRPEMSFPWNRESRSFNGNRLPDTLFENKIRKEDTYAVFP
jgi:hypothetical protein